MYHIPDDIRAQHSAELLYSGLMECLRHAEMTEITVTAVVRSAGCGRSTFYRLFDVPSDIAQWKCDQIIRQALQKAGGGKDFDEDMLLFVSSWMEHAEMIGALHRSSLGEMIYKAQIDHIKELQELFLKEATLSEQQQVHLSYILASLIYAVFQIWRTDMGQSSRELLEKIKDAVWELDIMFNHRRRLE